MYKHKLFHLKNNSIYMYVICYEIAKKNYLRTAQRGEN